MINWPPWLRCPACNLPFLAAIVAIFLPSESSAFIRHDMPDTAAFLAAETCGNDPVNQIDPTGEVGSAPGREMGLVDGPFTYAYANQWYEPEPLMAAVNIVPLALNTVDLGVNSAKKVLNERLGGGAGEATELLMVIGTGGITKVPRLVEEAGVLVSKAATAFGRAGRYLSKGMKWWQAERPLGSTVGSAQIAPSVERAEEIVATKSPAFNSIMRQVETVDVSTPRNGAVFWTGYEKGNQAAAMKWAAVNGKSTIEMTPGGQWLNNLDLYGPNSSLTRAQADAAWLRMSERFTEGASGHVNAFTRGTSYNPASTFYNNELPGLRLNPNVSPTITYRGY